MKDKFAVITPGSEIIFIDPADIYYFESRGSLCKIRSHGRETYLHNESIEEISDKLESPPFYRISKLMIINLDRVFKLKRNSLWDYQIRMLPPVNRLISVEKEKISGLKELLGI